MIMQHHSRLTNIVLGTIAAGATIFAGPTSALACTQIFVGDNYTANGDTYVGRNEDNAPRWEKVFGIQPAQKDLKFYSQVSNFTYTVPQSYRYTYVRDNKSYYNPEVTNAFPEAGENSQGVSVSATESTAYNSKIAKVDPVGSADVNNPWGIPEYNLAGLILSQAATARDGVQILGNLINKYGSLNCNQVTISDKNETWLFMLLSGHQWIAIKMPQNVVSINPNMGNLEFNVNINDSSSCLHSSGLVSTAQKAGSLVTYPDDQINIGASYGEVNSGFGQYDRLAQGRSYFGAPLSSSDYTTNSLGQITSLVHPQLEFTPGGTNYNTDFILRAFADRGVGTPFNANTNKNLYSIGNQNTVETNEFQINHRLSSDIATVQWESLSRPEFGIFIPNYSALLTKVSPLYGNINTWQGNTVDEASSDSVQEALNGPTNNLDEVMMDINTLCFNNRNTTAANVKAYFAVIQKQIIAQQQAVAQLMDQTPTNERTNLANEADEVITQSVYNKALNVLKELRLYLTSKDPSFLANGSTVFTPSDYDAATNTMRTPLVYAAAVINPTLTKQPAQSIQYKQNTPTTPLTAQAKEDDGVNGSSTTLTYTWYKTANKASADNIAAQKNSSYDNNATSSIPADMTVVGHNTSYTPSSAHAGTEYYVLRVTNAQGLYIDSNVTAISITTSTAASNTPVSQTTNNTPSSTQPSTPPTSQPSTPTTKQNKTPATNNNSHLSSLAKTGQALPIALLLTLFVTAVVGSVTVFYRKKKHPTNKEMN